MGATREIAARRWIDVWLVRLDAARNAVDALATGVATTVTTTPA